MHAARRVVGLAALIRAASRQTAKRASVWEIPRAPDTAGSPRKSGSPAIHPLDAASRQTAKEQF